MYIQQTFSGLGFLFVHLSFRFEDYPITPQQVHRTRRLRIGTCNWTTVNKARPLLLHVHSHELVQMNHFIVFYVPFLFKKIQKFANCEMVFPTPEHQVNMCEAALRETKYTLNVTYIEFLQGDFVNVTRQILFLLSDTLLYASGCCFSNACSLEIFTNSLLLKIQRNPWAYLEDVIFLAFAYLKKKEQTNRLEKTKGALNSYNCNRSLRR